MDTGFEQLKKEVEAELDRPIEQGEEITMKAMYYFGKGLKLKNQVESEPERLGDICKRVLLEIRKRCEQNPDNKAFKPTTDTHKQRVVSAVRDFMFSRSSRPKKLSGNRIKKQ